MKWIWPRVRQTAVLPKTQAPPGRGRGGNGGKGNQGGGGSLGPVTVGNLGGTNGTGVSSISWSHTCSGTKGLLIVAVSFDRASGGTPDVTGITYNGVAMTVLEVDLGSQNGRLSVWYLVNPDNGANTVEVTWDGSVTNIRTASRNFNGVHQTVPLGTHVPTTGGNNAPTATVTDAVSNGLVVDCLNVHGGGVSQRTFSIACSQTQQYNVTAPTGGNGHGGSYKSSAGSVTMCWAINTGAEWRLVAVAIKPG